MRIVNSIFHRAHGLSNYCAYSQPRRCLLTLAIETSADDTAVALVEKIGNGAQLLFNERITANQGQLKGIHPVIAIESHDTNLAGLIQKSLLHLPDATEHDEQSRVLKISRDGQHILKKQPDFVSATRGPGMRSSLSIGLNTAKGLAVAWQVPFIGVHHMQAHALTPRLVSAMSRKLLSLEKRSISPKFPYLSLLVSGGHTMLIRSESLISHRIVVQTSDYAIGDCLDKIGRILLPQQILSKSSSASYGPLLEKFAYPNGLEDYDYEPPRNWQDENRMAKSPSPYGWYISMPFATAPGGANSKATEFNFTGIESQARRICEHEYDKDGDKFQKTPRAEPMSYQEAQCLARVVMRVAFEHLANRVLQVLLDANIVKSTQYNTLVLSGGVASNQFLRHVMKSYLAARGYDNIQVVAPPVSLCTDNAAMIGWAACEMWESGYRSNTDIRALGKWSLENLMQPELESDARTWLENHPGAK